MKKLEKISSSLYLKKDEMENVLGGALAQLDTFIVYSDGQF